MIMLSVAIMGYTLADTADNVAKFHASVVPSNPLPGGDVIVDFSATEITQGFAIVDFALNFDKNIFTLEQVVASEGWDYTALENTYFITTNSQEETTETGTIITFHLKVKDSAVPGTETEISLTSIQIGTEADPIDFDDLKQTITISAPQQEGNRNETTGQNRNETTDGNRNETTNETRNEVSNNVRNETTGGNTRNEVPGGNTSLLTNTTRNETTGLPVQKVNQLENYTTNDKKPSIPQTGEDYGLLASIIGVSILSIVAFVIYRKNKI